MDQRHVIQRLGRNHMLSRPNRRASWRSTSPNYRVL